MSVGCFIANQLQLDHPIHRRHEMGIHLNKKKKQQLNILIQDQILRANLGRNVWQTTQRICIKILKIKELSTQ